MSGNASNAILRQSLGAGGGAISISGADRIETTIGGTAGLAGDGGSVTLNNTGNVYTDGTLSNGIVLQSIGGGGGIQLSDTHPMLLP